MKQRFSTGSACAKLCLTAAATVFSFTQQSSATSLDAAVQILPQSTSTFMAGGKARSFDGASAPDYLATFAPFVDASFLAFGSFAGPLSVEGDLVLEVAGYAGRNSFGVINSNGQFVELVSGASTPGSTYGKDLGTGTFTFALNSPDGLFSSIAANNADKQQHIIGQHITKAGTVSLSGKLFDVQVGDYVLYMEDLFGAVPRSDQDYNDSVVIIRASGTEVPEPATAFLLSSAGILGLRKRRKQAAK